MALKSEDRNAVLVLHGPNLGKLGTREPDIYGSATLDDINRHLEEMALLSDWQVVALQSNHEGDLIDAIENAPEQYQAIIINPAGLTHTSICLRDAIQSVPIPTIEVHLSQIAAREEFRHTSLISSVCRGTITGFGMHSYIMALWYIITTFSSANQKP
ncbi:type II 3-dehydroquinate dehydratase [candidate division CSSED10-310 bacterium]|uniref:3-dehydroquinate dehydratase n=1 Tax=candidate division CSSED10-310 bacterium TaxID=2855610 RepID=A0ABV6Z476_UNCC1